MTCARAVAVTCWPLCAALAASCSFDWDTFDPRLATPDEAGGSGGTAVECVDDGMPCGDVTATECDLPDSCTGGTCADNLVRAGEPCGEAADTACSDPDACDGLGQCSPRLAPDGSACADCASGVCGGCSMGACLGCATNADLTTEFTTGLGTAGIMFDLVATTAVEIVSFEVNLAPGTYDIAIYYRDGGYTGFDADASAWTQIGTATGVTATAGGAPTPILLPIDVVMPESAQYGWYITSTLSVGGTDQVLYGSGTAEGAVQLSDAHLQLLEGRAKEYPFGMPYFPRQWNGIVHYIACD